MIKTEERTKIWKGPGAYVPEFIAEPKTVDQIIDRLSTTEPDSPMTIIKCEEPGKLYMVYRQTALTAHMMKVRIKDVIGAYDNTMNLKLVERSLRGELA